MKECSATAPKPLRRVVTAWSSVFIVFFAAALGGCEMMTRWSAPITWGRGETDKTPGSKALPQVRKNARFGVVQRQDVTVKATASGKVVSARTTTIKASYAGFVQRVFVKVGDRVKQGQPLLAISEGVDDRSVSPFPMRAPFGGTVVEVVAQPGQQVEANKGGSGKDYLLRIEDFSAFAVEVDFPEIDATRVQLGMAATVRVTALPQITFPGVLTSLNLAGSQEAMFLSRRVLFPGLVTMKTVDSQMRPGLSALVDIEIAQKKGVLFLGHEYIGSREGSFFVTRADGTEVPIKLGLQNELGAEIVEGVAEGEEVRMVDYINSEAKTL